MLRAVAFVLLPYALMVSGIAYDLIVGPPSVGHFVDGGGRGRALPMRIGRANLNKQYTIEGVLAVVYIMCR